MPFREVSVEELSDIVFKLRNLPAWVEYTKFAKAFFGPEADTIRVTFENKYNDEGYEDDLTGFDVFDSAGHLLEPSTVPSVDFIRAYDPWAALAMEKSPEEYVGPDAAHDLFWETYHELQLPLGLDLDYEGDERELEFSVNDLDSIKPIKIFVEEGE